MGKQLFSFLIFLEKLMQYSKTQWNFRTSLDLYRKQSKSLLMNFIKSKYQEAINKSHNDIATALHQSSDCIYVSPKTKKRKLCDDKYCKKHQNTKNKLDYSYNMWQKNVFKNNIKKKGFMKANPNVFYLRATQE